MKYFKEIMHQFLFLFLSEDIVLVSRYGAIIAEQFTLGMLELFLTSINDNVGMLMIF